MERRPLLVPLAEVGMEAVCQFADDLGREPRYFGPTAVPRPSARWRSMLCHPAAVHGVAALVDDELVGMVRFAARPLAGVDLYIAVAGPWRRQGIATSLIETSIAVAINRGEGCVVAIAEHRRPAVRALAQRFFDGVTIDRPTATEYHRVAA
jgi:GNAT superfamily N-acetyltransferase